MNAGVVETGRPAVGSFRQGASLTPPSDFEIAGLAAAIFLGARLPGRLPTRFTCVLIISALIILRLSWPKKTRWGLIGLAILLVVAGSWLSMRSLDGLRISPTSLARRGWRVQLLTDPSRKRGTVEADGLVDGKHVQLRAAGVAATRLARLEAGDLAEVRGRLKNLSGPRLDWLTSRHIAGRMSVTSVDAAWHGSALARFANGIRSRLLRSGDVLPAGQRGLFAGFVLGDDRQQSPELIDDFRASGLSHLLVVSGQNVAFTMAAVEPVLSRFRRRPRLMATVGVLVVFATVTRFEPSVLRAVWMAGIVALARCIGRPQQGLRVLSLAVICLLAVDPLLSFSVGFALSMSATGGLALWSEVLAKRLPLPDRLRSVVAPTLAAQGGACLVMIPVFGSVPVVSLLANVVVLPFAAPLMAWGVAAGLPAGILGSFASRVVHLPTTLLLSIVAFVARTAGRLPLGSISVGPAVGFAFVTWWVCRSTSSNRLQTWMAALVIVSAWPSIACVVHRPEPDLNRQIARGVRVWSVADSGFAGRLASVSRSASIVEISYDVDLVKLLTALRTHRIRAIDMLVVASGGRPQGAVVRALRSRVSLGVVVVGESSFAGGFSPSIRVTRKLQTRMDAMSVTVQSAANGKLVLDVRPFVPVEAGSREVNRSRFSIEPDGRALRSSTVRGSAVRGASRSA